MSHPVPLRSDFDAGALRRAAKATKDAAQGRRLLAPAEIYDGGCSVTIWMVRRIASPELLPDARRARRHRRPGAASPRRW